MHRFDQDTDITPITPGQFQTMISGNWSINGIPNGGYLMALAAKTMLIHSDKKMTPILTANYLARSSPGAAAFAVETICSSSQFTRVQAKLFQHGQETVRAMGTFSRELDECLIVRHEEGPPELPSRDRCVSFPHMPKFTLYDQMDILLTPESLNWMQGNPANQSEIQGWAAFKTERPFDIPSIALITDSFPPPIFASQGIVGWVPTIELTISIRNIPQTTWLKCRFRTRHINCGLLEEDGDVWDENGELVAVSRQIAQFRKS